MSYNGVLTLHFQNNEVAKSFMFETWKRNYQNSFQSNSIFELQGLEDTYIFLSALFYQI